jgi:LDH2 family malate/lactate/ureidoglycolate dehydrogenase
MKYVIVPRNEVSQLMKPAYYKLGFTEGAILDLCLKMGNDGWQNGVSTHGHNVILINHGAFGIECGLIDPTATQHKVLWNRPSIQHWDGNKVAGPALALRAVVAAIEMAKETGVGNIQISNTGHVGCPGVLAKIIAELGYVGRVITRGGRVECMAPGGQESSRASTDTISWGLPTENIIGFPIVLDFTLAEIAMGKVRKALLAKKAEEAAQKAAIERGESYTIDESKFALPPGVCYGYGGVGTVDPDAVFPNGGVSFIGGYKGHGFAACNEVLGSFFGFKPPSVISDLQLRNRKEGETSVEDVRGVSVELEVSEVPTYEDSDTNVKQFVEYVFGGGKSGDLRIPGERRHKFSQLCEKHGGLLLSTDIVDWMTKEAFADVIKFDERQYQTIELED